MGAFVQRSFRVFSERICLLGSNNWVILIAKKNNFNMCLRVANTGGAGREGISG